MYRISFFSFNLAHLSRRPEPKAHKVSLCDGTGAGFCESVRPLTPSNLNISVTSGLIAVKLYLEHYWGWGKAALGFRPDQIRTLVSMATDSSHRIIIGEMLCRP